MSLVSSITWIPSDQLPDSDLTVLIHHPAADEPVWLGYFDDGESTWRTVDGARCEVSHWADLPETPND